MPCTCGDPTWIDGNDRRTGCVLVGGRSRKTSPLTEASTRARFTPDMCDRPPRVLDDDVPDIGGKRVRQINTPAFPTAGRHKCSTRNDWRAVVWGPAQPDRFAAGADKRGSRRTRAWCGADVSRHLPRSVDVGHHSLSRRPRTDHPRRDAWLVLPRRWPASVSRAGRSEPTPDGTFARSRPGRLPAGRHLTSKTPMFRILQSANRSR